MATNLAPGQVPVGGTTDSQPRQTEAYSGTGHGAMDPTLEPGNYADSLFGINLPQGTGAPGSQGASPGGAGDDPTNEPGQLNEGISGLGPDVIADTGAPGSAGAQNGSGGTDTVTYTPPGSYLSGTYQADTVTDSISGTNDWTQAVDGSYGGGPQLPGIDGNMPAGTGAGQGRVMRGGRAQGWAVQDLTAQAGAAWAALEKRAIPAPPAPVETATPPDGAEDARYNMFHAPAGSSGGGQFTTSGGSGKGSSGGQAAPAKHAPAKMAPAGKQHQTAHPQHGKPQTAQHGMSAKDKAARKKELHSEASADRHKAHDLQQKLHGLEQQEKKAQAASAQAAKTSKANASKASHINPHAHQSNPGASHAHKAAAKHGKTLKQQISDVRQQIHDLNAKADALDKQAAAL